MTGRVEPVYRDQLLALSFELVCEHGAEHAVPVVHRAFAECEGLAHVLHVQVLHADAIISGGEPVGRLVQEVGSLVPDLGGELGDAPLLFHPITGPLDHVAESALLAHQPWLHLPVETRVVGLFAVAGHVQAVGGVIQSDDMHGSDGFGCLGFVLEQYRRRVSTALEMFHRGAFELSVIGNRLVLAGAHHAHFGKFEVSASFDESDVAVVVVRRVPPCAAMLRLVFREAHMLGVAEEIVVRLRHVQLGVA